MDFADHKREIVQQGFTLIEDIRSDQQAVTTLAAFGKLMPQYDGSLSYQVKAAPGFERRSYSKSVNTILVHTEAPGWNPPPKCLALHCRIQASCGGGHTDLADMRALTASLSEEERAALERDAVEWPGHNMAGTGVAGVSRPIVERGDDGEEVFRFSYNLLTTGQYDPPVDTITAPADLPLGDFGVRLTKQAEEFFREYRVSVLIPRDCILVWDNHRMVHARSAYRDSRRHLTRYWIAGLS